MKNWEHNKLLINPTFHKFNFVMKTDVKNFQNIQLEFDILYQN
jgi:hypothetical protein